nr:MAG TPA: hypothetical protein [Caudoviricetes sp.]
MRFTKYFENVDFGKLVAVPSNKLEQGFLQALK